MRRGTSVVQVLVGVSLLVLLATLAMPALVKTKCEEGNRSRCANALRQIALAAIQYSDDKRVFPHVGARKALDGDMRTSDTPRAIRSLVWYGYHDQPDYFVCRDAADAPLPIANQAVREDMKLWAWGGAVGDPQRSPLESTTDPTLLETQELSYAYTRRGLTANAPAGALLASDRGVRVAQDRAPGTPPGHAGNHLDSWVVVDASASTSYLDARARGADGMVSGDRLRGTDQGQGALPVSPLADPGLAAPR